MNSTKQIFQRNYRLGQGLNPAVQQPKEGKQGASKSKGKKKAQATEGVEAP